MSRENPRARGLRCSTLSMALAAATLLGACTSAGMRSGTLSSPGDTSNPIATTPAPTTTASPPTSTPGADGTPPSMATADAAAPGSSVDTAPIDTAPIDTAPVDTAPIETDPADASATGTTPSAADCPTSERGAVVYRPLQRGVLCEAGAIVLEFPVTTARRVPRPGQYTVSSRNRWVRSTIGGHISFLTNFVAFTEQSPRIAFHTVPKDPEGRWVQPLSSVGSLRMLGKSAGCIRVLPKTSAIIWDFLRNGDLVRIIG